MVKFNQKMLVTVGTLLALTAADWVLGVLASMRTHTFDIKRLPDQLENTALPLLVPIVIAAVMTPADWENAIVAASAPVAIKLLADIKDKLAIIANPTVQGPAPVVVSAGPTSISS